MGVGATISSGGSAGCIACTLTYPLDLIRTPAAADDGETLQPHRGRLDENSSRRGRRGLYRGLKPTLIGVGPNLALNFRVRTLRNHLQELDHGVHRWRWTASGSAAAVVSATAISIDLVRRRMQMRSGERGRFVGVFKRVLAKEGDGSLSRHSPNLQRSPASPSRTVLRLPQAIDRRGHGCL